MLPLLRVSHAAATACWIAATLSLAPAASAEPPAYSFEPYGYLPWVRATTTIRGFETDTDLTPGQVLRALQSVGSARASVEFNRTGVLLDGAYTQLGAEPSFTTPRGRFSGSAELATINGIYDVALRHRFGDREAAVAQPGSWWLIPYAGVRVVQARLDVAANVRGNGPLDLLRFQGEGSLQRTWTQMLVGTQASVHLTPGLRLFARADAAGFGLSGAQDLSGNAQAGLGLALGRNTDLNLSWRHFGVAYNNGGRRPNGFTSQQDGIELGVKFYF